MDVYTDRALGALALVRRFVPAFRVVPKSASRLQRLLGRLFALLGAKNYLTEVWTTFRYRTYAPASEDKGATPWAWHTILHEGWHGVQWRRRGPWMGASYALPQLLGGLALLVVPLLALLVGPGAWWGLLALLALAPWPAYWRAQLELEAYKVSAALDYWSWGALTTDYPEWYVAKFAGPLYYWMWPFKRATRRRFEAWGRALQDGSWMRTERGEYLAYLRACRALARSYRD